MALSYKLQSLNARLRKIEKDNQGIERFPDFQFEAQGTNKELLTLEDSELLVAGPAGTGKTSACLAKIHQTCIDNPHTRALIVRKTRASLAETVLHSFESTILGPGHPLLSGATRVNRKAYVYPNGSRIVIGGMDSPSRIMSSDYDIVFGAEATEFTEEDVENLLTRLRNYQLPYQQLLLDCNPASASHWLYRRFQRGSIKMLESKHQDNPLLFNAETGEWTEKGKEYLKKLDNLSGVRRKRLRLGLWVSAEGAVYENYDMNVHIISGHMPVFQSYLTGMDIGFKNAGTMLTFGITADNTMILVDEVYRTGQTLDWWIEQAQKVQVKYRPDKFIVDPSAASQIQSMCLNGLPAIKGNNKIKFGVDLMQQRINDRTIKFHVNSLKTPDPILKDNLLPLRLTDEIQGYVYDEKKELPVPVFNHALDAARYVVAFHDKPVNSSLPATSTSIPLFGKNKSSQWKVAG